MTASSSRRPLARAAAPRTPSARSASSAPTVSSGIAGEVEGGDPQDFERLPARQRLQRLDRLVEGGQDVEGHRVGHAGAGKERAGRHDGHDGRPAAGRLCGGAPSPPGTASASRASPSSTRTGSAEPATSGDNASRCAGTGLRSELMTWLRVALCQLDHGGR